MNSPQISNKKKDAKSQSAYLQIKYNLLFVFRQARAYARRNNLFAGSPLGSLDIVEIGRRDRRPRVREEKTPAGVDAPAGVVQSES
jgi:hypothetical protein